MSLANLRLRRPLTEEEIAAMWLFNERDAANSLNARNFYRVLNRRDKRFVAGLLCELRKARKAAMRNVAEAIRARAK